MKTATVNEQQNHDQQTLATVARTAAALSMATYGFPYAVRMRGGQRLAASRDPSHDM